MSYFAYSDNDFFGSQPNNKSIECIKCSDSPDYMRCKCCNEIVTIVDIIKHELKNGVHINLVKFNGLNCIKVLGKNVQKILKYIRNSGSTVDGLDFEYKANYITSKTVDGQEKKVINNIEYVREFGSFKPDTLNLKYVIMCNFPTIINGGNPVPDDGSTPTVEHKGCVLIDVRKLNVKIPDGLF